MKPEQDAAGKIWAAIATAQIISAKHVEEIIAEAFAGERARAKLQNQALNHLHAKTQEECNVFFEQDGKPIEICTDLGEAYAESALCEKVIQALTADDAEALAILKEKGNTNA